MSLQNLSLEIEGGIARLTIERPKALNALDRATLDEIEDVIETLRTREEARAVILTGSGEKAFVAGADLNELADLDARGARRVAEHGQRVFRSLETMGKPVIAAINGFALGGGLELALAATMRVASENAKLGLPEVKLGIIPGYGGTQRLARLIGRGIAQELILTGAFVDAKRALAIGLVNRVVPREDLIAAAEEIARAIQGVGPLAVRAALAAVDEGLETTLEGGLEIEARRFGDLFETEDAHEGIRAFLEKRPATFQGR